MDITVRVEVQYVAPERARVRDVLHMFRSPAWVRFMVRYISPHLRSAAPADRSVLDALAPAAPAADGACVICMSDLCGSDADAETGTETEGEAKTRSETETETQTQTETETESAAVRLPCGHCFHGSCVRAWLQLRSTCPSCRFQFRKAFAGSYAVRTLNSALRLKPELRRLRRDAVLDASVARETVRAVVHVTLGQVPACDRERQYPCVLNALLLHADADEPGGAAGEAARPVMDKPEAAGAGEDRGAKRLRVA